MNVRGVKNKNFCVTGACGRPVFFCLMVLAAIGGLTVNAQAARVDDLYGAIGNLPKAGAQLNVAFDEALSQVLVKVTGLPELGGPGARNSLFADSARVVQRYSMLSDTEVRVEFDSKAVRNVLDRAGQPVWGRDRPLVALWLAIDAGGGQRVILAEGSRTPIATDPDALERVCNDLETVADQRGLPIVLPLADAQDLRQVSFSDLWGDFRQPVVAASKRYGAEAVLIGRTRSLDPVQQGVRWTLVAGDEQASWQGDLANGPAYAAEFFAQRLATYADSAGALRVLVTDVDSLDAYGQLQNYFGSLNIVESASVVRVNGDSVEFELVVRGDLSRLSRALDANRQLQSVAIRAAEEYLNTISRRPDLVYAWSTKQ
ncbi:MAG: hypothetical protein CL799_08970 [Chromatiales bacterium]|jgi:hypothetical protein|nr:hypothetical protein [Chromatiales bacterium]MDP6150221.1 DUF2066 domain-containing protein [Gammaproteobacteria bacterium]MDP7093854.1 DUF2066 domain-containing protein [Gammaproteobacteria bacterium]HJP04894.1 DUF2066 domain-containing protein [Gammaproteobacteria bacterium]